jgi:hypothetical protein
MTVFAPKIFGFVGVTGQETKLFTTGIFGIVKLLSSLAAAFFIVDLLGRKFAVMAGLTIQAISAFYLAMYLRFHYTDAPTTETSSSKAMADVAIFFIFLSGFAWAIGVNSVQYLSQTEMVCTNFQALRMVSLTILPLTVQLGISIIGCCHHFRRSLLMPIWIISISQPDCQLWRSLCSLCLLLCHELGRFTGESFLHSLFLRLLNVLLLDLSVRLLHDARSIWIPS